MRGYTTGLPLEYRYDHCACRMSDSQGYICNEIDVPMFDDDLDGLIGLSRLIHGFELDGSFETFSTTRLLQPTPELFVNILQLAGKYQITKAARLAIVYRLGILSQQ